MHIFLSFLLKIQKLLYALIIKYNYSHHLAKTTH